MIGHRQVCSAKNAHSAQPGPLIPGTCSYQNRDRLFLTITEFRRLITTSKNLIYSIWRTTQPLLHFRQSPAIPASHIYRNFPISPLPVTPRVRVSWSASMRPMLGICTVPYHIGTPHPADACGHLNLLLRLAPPSIRRELLFLAAARHACCACSERSTPVSRFATAPPKFASSIERWPAVVPRFMRRLPTSRCTYLKSVRG